MIIIEQIPAEEAAYMSEVHELVLRLAAVPGDGVDAQHRAAPRRRRSPPQARGHLPLEKVLDMVRQAWTSIERGEAASGCEVSHSPKRRQDRFEEARAKCAELAQAANADEKVKEANRLLVERGEQGRLAITYDVGLHPELKLADPEDARRAERLQRSVAEAIGLVLRAVRSQDREQIRQALESAGALAQACGDPDLRGQVERVLQLAQETTRTLTEQARAQGAQARSTREQVRAAAADRAQRAAQALEGLQAQATQAEQALSRWQILDVQDDSELAAELTYEEAQRRFRERRAAQERQEAADRRGSLLEVGERPALGPEEEAMRVAAQLELEQRQREAETRERGRLLEVG